MVERAGLAVGVVALLMQSQRQQAVRFRWHPPKVQVDTEQHVVGLSQGSGEWTSATRRELGRVAVRSGRVDEGQALLERARTDLFSLGLKVEAIETDAALVEVALAAKAWQDALTQADEVLARAVSLDAATAVRLLHRHRAAALVGLGRLDEARAALERALVLCQDEGQVDMGVVLTELAQVALEQGDPCAAELHQRGRQYLRRLGHVD